MNQDKKLLIQRKEMMTSGYLLSCKANYITLMEMDFVELIWEH